MKREGREYKLTDKEREARCQWQRQYRRSLQVRRLSVTFYDEATSFSVLMMMGNGDDNDDHDVHNSVDFDRSKTSCIFLMKSVDNEHVNY